MTSAVKQVAESIRTALEGAAPDETTVEISFDIRRDSGLLVAALAKSESSAGIKVELKWKKSDEKAP